MNFKKLSPLLTVFLVLIIVLTAVIIKNQLLVGSHLGLDGARTIRVSGEETITERPDEAEIRFGVIGTGEDYTAATEENSLQMEAVIEYLKTEGIEEEKMRTVNFRVSPVYDQTERTRGEIVGYEVRNDLQVKFEYLDRVDEIIAGAINSGANNVSGLLFSVSNEEDLKAEAREVAIEKAKEEAKIIADSLGVRLGRIIDFSESRQFQPFRADDRIMMEEAEAGRVPIELGENEIISSVTITFEIK